MPSVLIATPMQRGQLEPDCYHSLMAARRDLFSNGIQHNVTSTSCSVISESRNSITMEFLNHMRADYLMWVDSDMRFPPWGIRRLMSRNVDIIGGVYHRKEAEARPLVFEFTEDGQFRTREDFPFDKVFEVDGIATGFLLIKRDVLLNFTSDVVDKIGTPFGLGYSPVGKEEGEDLSFSRRAKKLGYKVWADPTIPLGHIGSFSYTRDKWLEARKFKQWARERFTYSNDIPGWMGVTELNWLHNTASKMDTIVEVGSWKGRSTHALLSSCNGSVTAIDTWKGSKGETEGPHAPHAEAKDGLVIYEFLENVGQFSNLTVMKMDSVEAAKLFEDKSVDMVFIDAGHSYEDVKTDIEAWLPKARKLICGHDYYTHTVQEAVTEKFGEPDLAESIWIKRLGEDGALRIEEARKGQADVGQKRPGPSIFA